MPLTNGVKINHSAVALAWMASLSPCLCGLRHSIPVIREPNMRRLCFALAATLTSVASYTAIGDEPSQGFTPSTRTMPGTQIGHYQNGPAPVDLSTPRLPPLLPTEQAVPLRSQRGNDLDQGTRWNRR